jgi:predicted dehydrogenase
MAAALDGKIDLVAGAFSSNADKSKASGEELNLDTSRVYASYQEMAEKEAALPDDQKIDFVSIVVRNDLHYDVAKTFLEAGFNVICEKPLAFTLEQGKELVQIVNSTGKVFALTHNYTGYPMVKEAKAMVAAGKLGKIIKVVAEYPQGYAITALKDQADGAISNWRMDPEVSGASNCIGDIGSHAENLVRYITGLEIDELAAELSTFIPGRPLDDDGNMLVRFKGGAKGIIYASQISAGDENNLNIRVYGTDASLEWHQEHPNELIVKFAEEPRQIHRRGNVYNGEICAQFTRIPFGHPEGFIEAFANVYLGAAKAIEDEVQGKYSSDKDYDFPTVQDGVDGMAFIKAAVDSSKANAAWTKLDI